MKKLILLAAMCGLINSLTVAQEITTHRYPDRSVYTGQLVDGKRHGTGTYVWPDGRRYEGQWQNDRRSGQGSFVWLDGARYDGQWLNDKRTGPGTYTWKNGSRYLGQWLDDLAHGQGSMTWADGRKYEGNWREDKRSGQGTMTWPDGRRYEGYWRNNEMRGHGSMFWSNGDEYTGQWRADKRHGQGTMIWADGRKFTGQWAYDEMQKPKKETGSTFYVKGGAGALWYLNNYESSIYETPANETVWAQTFGFDLTFNIGFAYEYSFGRFALITELLYDYQRLPFRVLNANIENEYVENKHSFMMPLGVRSYIFKSYFIDAGAYLDYSLFSGSADFNQLNDNAFNFGLIFDIGKKFGDLCIFVRYRHGLRSIETSAVTLNVAYNIF